MSEVGTRDARIREQLGAWWAEEFPAVVMPTEALIRLSERLAALSPVTRIRATGSIDDGQDRRLPDPQTVTDAFGVPFMQISTPAPSPSAEEEARGLVQMYCRHLDSTWVGYCTGCEPLSQEVATALAKRKADEETVAGWWREAQDHISELIDLLGRASEVAGGYADDFADLPERIATALAKRDAEIAEYAAHEEQTHRILGGILGTDDSLERCAKRMRERAEAAEARLEAMRAVVEAARVVAASPAEFDDERIGYVVLQVNRIDLSGLRQALGALDI